MLSGRWRLAVTLADGITKAVAVLKPEHFTLVERVKGFYYCEPVKDDEAETE